jgi:copper chaperone NosL
VVFGLLLLAACGGSAVDIANEPPEIVIGEDVCSGCNMIINDINNAAAYWTTDGEPRRFDDIGGMLVYMQKNQEERASTWVHDFNTAEWVRAEDAWYVMNAGLVTPMASGLVSVANEADARALAEGHPDAVVFTFDEMMAGLAAGEVKITFGQGMTEE